MEQNQKFTYHTPDLWETNETEKLDAALVAFNEAFNAVAKDAKAVVPGRSERKYASLDGILVEIRPILAKHGLFVQQPIAGDKIVTIIRHSSGQFRAASVVFSAMQGTGTNALQNMGGGFTYIKRYALSAMLSLATEVDDDGEKGGVKPVAQAKQAAMPAPRQEPKIEDEIEAISLIRGSKNKDELTKVWNSLSKTLQETAIIKQEGKQQKETFNQPAQSA